MPRRAVLATVATAVVLAGSAAPALASTLSEPTQVCVLTTYDPNTGSREGVCVWVPVDSPLGVAASR